MADVIILSEERKKMAAKSISKVNEMLDQLDPKDPNFTEKAKAITAEHKVVVDDLKAQEAIRVSESRQKSEGIWNGVRSFLQAVGIIVPAVAMLSQTKLMEKGRNERLEKASKYEDDGNAYLSMSDKTVVQDGLKEQRPGGLLGMITKIF